MPHCVYCTTVWISTCRSIDEISTDASPQSFLSRRIIPGEYSSPSRQRGKKKQIEPGKINEGREGGGGEESSRKSIEKVLYYVFQWTGEGARGGGWFWKGLLGRFDGMRSDWTTLYCLVASSREEPHPVFIRYWVYFLVSLHIHYCSTSSFNFTL